MSVAIFIARDYYFGRSRFGRTSGSGTSGGITVSIGCRGLGTAIRQSRDHNPTGYREKQTIPEILCPVMPFHFRNFLEFTRQQNNNDQSNNNAKEDDSTHEKIPPIFSFS